MIVSFKLLGYCFAIGAVYLIIMNFIWNRLEKYIPVMRGFPKDLVEQKNPAWFVSNFIIEFIFFVLLPAIIYGWFYTVLPFSGLRGGLSVGLYLFLFGIVPVATIIMFRIKIPALYFLYLLVGLFFKVMGAMIIIGYLYSL
ncbi:MAG TPA: hypothetical protein ENL22_04070 [candidate division Zixibacteria bacterium]|nr:hypothetical protein [candidate division Zixibacteria bacterium]